jgi:hypothetical protein
MQLLAIILLYFHYLVYNKLINHVIKNLLMKSINYLIKLLHFKNKQNILLLKILNYLQKLK